MIPKRNIPLPNTDSQTNKQITGKTEAAEDHSEFCLILFCLQVKTLVALSGPFSKMLDGVVISQQSEGSCSARGCILVASDLLS